MGSYTDFFEKQAAEIFETEDYIEECRRILHQFRSFDQGLDAFIVEHGYAGKKEDVDEKVHFVADRCRQAGIPVPRNLKCFFMGEKRMKRESAVPFQLCFAFGLSLEEVNDFLRRICLSRGLDCHSVREAVYYYAFKKGLSYKKTQEILAQTDVVAPGKIDEKDLVYTDLIEEELDEIETTEELLTYLQEQGDKFAYNNVAASESIQTLWKEIAGEEQAEGLAQRERKKLYLFFNREKADETEKERKTRIRVDSMWEIYLQILGLAGNYTDELYQCRSIKEVLKDNELLHPLAEEAFPDRDGLNKILHGEHVSYERVRKLLILLVFYRFYGSLAVRHHSYEADPEERKRCIDALNDNLLSVGYPLLYPGNPYDFLFLMAIRSPQPLCTFREYMRELFFAKKEINLRERVMEDERTNTAKTEYEADI